MQYSGPIPPPEMMREFDSIVPGAADRILSMAERQEAHRHSLEKAHVRSNLISQYIGQVSGLGGLALVFIIGRRRQERERREKLGQLDQIR